MKLTEHFSLQEFAVSGSFPQYVEPVPEAYAENYRELAEVLEVLRPYTGPMRILSGYRSARLNTAVDGSPTSQHRVGQACDVSVASPVQLFRLTMTMLSKQSSGIGQVIWYPKKSFVHIALKSPRYPVLTACVHDPKEWNYQLIAGPQWLIDKGYE